MNRRKLRQRRAHGRGFSVFSVYFVSSGNLGFIVHTLFQQASELTHDVIGAAIEVHKDKGPGLLESIYEWCLTMELEHRGHHVQNQDEVIVQYKPFQRQFPLRFDLLIEPFVCRGQSRP
jgi:hypothetical protein